MQKISSPLPLTPPLFFPLNPPPSLPFDNAQRDNNNYNYGNGRGRGEVGRRVAGMQDKEEQVDTTTDSLTYQLSRQMQYYKKYI